MPLWALFPYAPTALWPCCPMVLRLYGPMALRPYGSMALRPYGPTALCPYGPYGPMALRPYGPMALRPYGPYGPTALHPYAPMGPPYGAVWPYDHIAPWPAWQRLQQSSPPLPPSSSLDPPRQQWSSNRAESRESRSAESRGSRPRWPVTIFAMTIPTIPRSMTASSSLHRRSVASASGWCRCARARPERIFLKKNMHGKRHHRRHLGGCRRRETRVCTEIRSNGRLLVKK